MLEILMVLLWPEAFIITMGLFPAFRKLAKQLK